MHQQENRKTNEQGDTGPKKLSLQQELDNQALVRRGLQIANEEYRVKTIQKKVEEPQA